ncbi:helix-turn-helix domain-containing protein [Streptomyces sp. F63]|uniref:helix-turn-helix domain-containing protein n=1 Tax=Streptomyces sp. F63 TaxID=2824887 RepID=UPI001B35E30E|nr:helix-turn-helix domain-containing protein [Streptomyces sp. F63]MBQ0986318.1 helix-turn-helix domain-containing protein [Streptomyces sp. F63]
MLEQPAFGQRLRSLRLACGLSQAELAAGGLSTAYLSRLESGARRPTDKVIEHLTQRLNVPVSAFQGEAATEVSQLGQALAWASSSDNRDRALHLLEEATQAPTGDLGLRWMALWSMVQLYADEGRRQEELKTAGELVTLSRAMEMPDLRVRALAQHAKALRSCGDMAQARMAAEEALAIATEHALPAADIARALLVLVSAEAESGLLADARKHADEMEALAGELHRTLLTEVLWAAANVHMRQSDFAGAERLLERALQELDSRDDLVLWMRLRLAAASLYLQMTPRKLDAAEQRLGEAEQALNLVGTQLHQQELVLLKAFLALNRRDIDQADALCRQLTDDSLFTFRDRIRLKLLANQILIARGEKDRGVRNVEELAQQTQDSSNVYLTSEIWRTLAETLSWATRTTDGA